jgi:hypothetical protein
MIRIGKNVNRALWSACALGLLYAASSGLESALAGTRMAGAVGMIGVDRAEAQYGVNRRVARRTSRRVTNRNVYDLPAGHQTAVVGGSTYYVAGDTRYEAVMSGGEVVYVVVDN